MKIIWSRAAGRRLAKIDVGYQRKIMQRIHDIGDRCHSGRGAAEYLLYRGSKAQNLNHLSA